MAARPPPPHANTRARANTHPRARSNFCARAGLARTAAAFEAEWYEAKAAGRLGGLATGVPDVHLRNGVRCAAAARRAGKGALAC